MAKNLDLNRLEGLLLEINSQFDEIKNMDSSVDVLQLELLEATTNYLSANIAVMRRSLEKSGASVVQVPKIRTEAASDEKSDENHLESPLIVPIEEVDFQHKIDIDAFEDHVGGEDYAGLEEPVDAEDHADLSVVENSPVPVEESVVFHNPIVPEEEEAFSPMEEDLTHVGDNYLTDDSLSEEVEEPFEMPLSPVPVTVPETVVEQDRPLTLNEIIANQRKDQEPSRNFSGMHQNVRATDLKTSISLNDKLLFIKELFNGYSLAYSEAIEILNRFEDLGSADAFLQSNYSLKNRWSDRPEAVEKFYSILSKKFNR